MEEKFLNYDIPNFVKESPILDDTDVPYATTYYHDIALDCGGNTYEQAVLNFAKNVWLQTHGMLKDKEARRDAIFERWVKDSGCESD